MNFERETWRPLFVREPVAQRGWSLFTRGLRTYLIRVAEDDGTLLKHCADPAELGANLSAHANEAELLRLAIATLLHDGFLRWEGSEGSPGWLGVDRLVTFGPGDSEAPDEAAEVPLDETPAERQRRKARERKERWKRSRGRSTGVPSTVPENVPGNVPERLPPQSPLSEREINKDSGRASVPDTVPRNVPATVPRNVPERERIGRSGPAHPKPVTSLRPTEDSGARGYERIEPQMEHQRFAQKHGLNLDDYVGILRRNPRAKTLSTTEAWGVLTRMLEKAAAAKQRKLGGAA